MVRTRNKLLSLTVCLLLYAGRAGALCLGSSAAPDTIRAATAKLKAGDLAGAERLLKQVAHVGKAGIGDPEVFNLLGFICDQTGRFTEANAFYLEALKLAPRSTRIHNNLGTHYFRTGQIGSAQAEFETVLRLDQN